MDDKEKAAKLTPQQELDDLTRRVEEWVRSTDGIARLTEAQKAISSALQASGDAARIDPELLRQPVTL